jgi:hypothetical protein
MDFQIRWHIGIDLFKKLEIFQMAMAVFARREYSARQDVQRSK